MIKKEDFQQNNLNNAIDLKEVIKSVLRYKYMIVLITMIFTFSAVVFAYFKPNIYSSSITFELNDSKSSGANNILIQAIDGQTANLENEKEILMSRFLAYKAFEYVDLNTRYFKKGTKTSELYKNSPFIVSKEYIEDFMYGKEFILTPIDESTFNLKLVKDTSISVDGLLKLIGLRPYSKGESIVYDANHKYGETISNEYFSINVNKLQKFSNGVYSFKFLTDLSNYYMFRSNISVAQTSRSSTILKINYTDVSAARAKDILNALVKSYMQEEVSQKTIEANLTLDFIDSQIESLNARLKISESKLENFKEENKVIGLSEQAAMITGKLSEYEAKLEELQTELNILENLSRYINSNDDLTGLSIGGINFADPSLGNLIVKLQEQVTIKSSLLVNYTDIHPDVVKAGQNIASLKRTIKATLDSNLRQLKQRRALIKENIEKYNKSVASVPKQESELSRLTRFYNIDEKVYSYLLEKKAETAILKSSTISKSRILDEAIANNSPIKPKRTMIVLVGIILGLIVGLAYAFLREFFNNTVKNSDDVERLSGIPIYGIVPNEKDKKAKKLVDEAFRAIRTNLQFLPKHDKSNIIAITSSVSGEGKTTTTANLAKIIAQTGKKVVVLDLDLRKSSIHKKFDIPNNIGISSYLSGQNSLEEITNKIDENVHVLTTGPLPPNPSELILTDIFKDMLETLKTKYDYVIMDTPPVGLVTDALILMNYADINFVLARASYTRKEFVKNLDRLSKEHNQHTFGFILNGVEIGEKYGYGYGSNYGYGYGNDKYYKDR